MVKRLKRLGFRMWDWVLAAITCTVIVYFIAPHQLSIVVYKITLVAFAANLAFWVDHSLFKRVNDRVEGSPRDLFSAACMIRRALIFAGCVLGLSLGV